MIYLWKRVSNFSNFSELVLLVNMDKLSTGISSTIPVSCNRSRRKLQGLDQYSGDQCGSIYTL